jgi:membrane-associated phospholipid phosphatase
MKSINAHIVLLIITLFVANLHLSAQESYPKFQFGPYVKSGFSDSWKLLKSPGRWEKQDWVIASGVIAATGVAMVFDEEIAAFAQRNRSPFFDDANAYFFDPFGKMYYTVPLMGAFLVYGSLSKNKKPQWVALDFFKASVYSAVLVTSLKHIAHRHRPFQTTDRSPHHWDGPFTNDWNHTSFPSGHTIMAWTFASVLATHYKDYTWVPITAYSLATMAGLARVYGDKHWMSDVVVGAALGYAIGKWVVNKSSFRAVKLSPSMGMNYQGLNLQFSF